MKIKTKWRISKNGKFVSLIAIENKNGIKKGMELTGMDRNTYNEMIKVCGSNTDENTYQNFLDFIHKINA